ncbi:MAG TPA: imidazolonepropionase, partial [Anaeromyxobacteraceae bacterium]|nr:imidazolonepropionase [Anaeromyxobacteraceae bacterium]
MWDLLVRRVRIVSLAPGAPPDGLPDGALAVAGGRIAWLGREADLPAGAGSPAELEAGGGLVTPGLVDCHTHLVHAGHRAGEWARRLAGETYPAIARGGGGILATVRATRAADEASLLAASLPRLDALLADGVTTVEVKSGYGLEREAELRMLRAARALGRERRVAVRTSFLGAHAVPPEFAGRADAYLALLCDDVLPAARAEGLVDAVDAYLEPFAFSAEQVGRLFEAAARLGLPVRLHADQLGDRGGAALAARHRALSADHLEHVSPEGIAALARAGTVAVLLPGAFYFLRESTPPPVAALRAAGVPMAVATDLNPGTSPLGSLLAAVNMACTLLGLGPAEALAGATREAARALGLPDRGVLAPGLRADLALWAADHPVELASRIGLSPLVTRVVAGVP